MLYKESAIAVMVAVMLGAASLLGGFSAIPALATHDPDAEQIARVTVSQDDADSMIVETVELSIKKSTLRASGTLTIELLQGDVVLTSTDLGTSIIPTTPKTIEVDVTNTEITGSFDVLVEYLGSGVVTVSNIEVNEDTEVAGNPDEEEEPANDDPSPPQEQTDMENVIASKTVAPESEDGMTIDTVEFVAKKSTLRARGTLTIAIVQDNMILDKNTMSTSAISTIHKDLESAFDIDVQGDFQVVFMYEGSGVVTVNDIIVPGATEPAEIPAPNPDPDPDPDPDPSPRPTSGSDTIAVYAYRIPSEFWGPTFTGANAQMWFTVHNSTGYALLGHGSDEDGYTFTGLNDGEQYIVVAHDCDECHDDPHDVLFDHWENGSTDRVRFVTTGASVSAYFEFDPDP